MEDCGRVAFEWFVSGVVVGAFLVLMWGWWLVRKK